MSNKNYERGRRREWQSRDNWQERGYTVIRASGSKGPFDLVAVKAGSPVELIQVKDLKTGTERQACIMIKKFQLNPPLTPSIHYHQVLEVYAAREMFRGNI